MLGASTALIYEGGREGVLRLSCGIVLGVILIALTQRLIQHDVVDHVGSLQGADARKALMIVGVMTIHSFTEGIGIGRLVRRWRGARRYSSQWRSRFITSPRDWRSAWCSSRAALEW